MILLSIQRPIAVLMICIGLLVLGVISWNRIPLELMPPIEQPEFKVTTAVPGVGTTEVEETVTTPLERSFSTIPGIIKTESVTSKEKSEIELKLRPNIDILQTINSIRERIDSAGLPEGVGKSKITRSGAKSGKALVEIAVWPKKNEPITSEFAKIVEVELAKKN